MATGLENLKVYQMAEELEVEVYKVLKTFPKDEKYSSTDQLKRSSAAVSNNIAEGYARHSYAEKVRYMYIAKGEAEETKRNLIRSGKKELISLELASSLADRYTDLLKALSGYIGFIKEHLK
ncbi:MAG: four helix bundle protein [Candidatus Zambryskibacteria bacterium]|nr:four helix bundle protein [Candidatus Zambryskibacteria bacterium]